jgi:hypothetical protein
MNMTKAIAHQASMGESESAILSGHSISRLLADLRLMAPDVVELINGPVTVQIDPGLILSSGDGEQGEQPASVLRLWIDTAVDDDGLSFRRELGEFFLAVLKALADGICETSDPMGALVS